MFFSWYCFVITALWTIYYIIKCGDCGEKNSPHSTAVLTKIQHKIHGISYKNSSHLFSNLYWTWFKFTRNIKDARDIWGSGIRSWRHEGSKRFEPVKSFVFFVRILRAQLNKIIHRDSSHSPQKAIKNMRWKLFSSTTFHRIFYKNLPPNLDPGCDLTSYVIADKIFKITIEDLKCCLQTVGSHWAPLLLRLCSTNYMNRVLPICGSPNKHRFRVEKKKFHWIFIRS